MFLSRFLNKFLISQFSKNLTFKFGLLVVIGLGDPTAFAATTPPSAVVLPATQNSSPLPLATSSNADTPFGPRPLDGVYVEALQSYSNPKSNQVSFDFGLWPVQPYYNGFSLGGSYTYYIDKDHAWEVINASYLYTVDTGLTTELANKYSVNPTTIERVNFIVSSNYLKTLAYGKFIFFGNHIRYFRSSALIGPALVSTNQGNNIGACIGWTFETFVNDRTSWKLGIRDNYSFGDDHPNNVVFTLGTSYGF